MYTLVNAIKVNIERWLGFRCISISQSREGAVTVTLTDVDIERIREIYH